MSNKESNVEKTNFDAFIQAVGSEIEQAQVRLSWVTPRGKILNHQTSHGYGQISKKAPTRCHFFKLITD